MNDTLLNELPVDALMKHLRQRLGEEPEQLDLQCAGTQQLVDELRKRFHSVVISAFPLVPTTVPQPINWIYGSYHLALAMSINLSDRLRAAGSMQRLELEDPHG